MVRPLVVIVNGDREHLFGMVLADHIVIEDLDRTFDPSILATVFIVFLSVSQKPSAFDRLA
jgi:hypothetical protein